MLGHDDLKKRFTHLADAGDLSHAYIFFGDQNLGKFNFALRLAHYFEFDSFEIQEKTLTECLIVKPVIEETRESIGIDEVRSLKNFLYQAPVNSKYRLAIIDGAEYLTDQAQNAILKIAEEPPEHGVLVLVTANPDALIKTLQSRFQKIYFPRVGSAAIREMLEKEYKVPVKKAEEISAVSFGRPGLAVNLATDGDNRSRLRKDVDAFLAGRTDWKEAAKYLAEIDNRRDIYPFLEFLIAKLSVDPEKNFEALRSITKRLSAMQETSANKRLQLEAALFPLKESGKRPVF